MMAVTPWVGVPSNVSMDVSRYEEKKNKNRSGSELDVGAARRCGRSKHVEGREVGAVTVERLIVEIGKLLCDGVDICHGC